MGNGDKLESKPLAKSSLHPAKTYCLVFYFKWSVVHLIGIEPTAFASGEQRSIH